MNVFYIESMYIFLKGLFVWGIVKCIEYIDYNIIFFLFYFLIEF